MQFPPKFLFFFLTLERLNYRFSLLLVDCYVILSRKNMRVARATQAHPGPCGRRRSYEAHAPVAGVNTVDNRLPVLQWNHVKYVGYATYAHFELVAGSLLVFT